MAPTKNHYSILGVNRDASDDDVRRAYRQAAQRLHPDKNERLGDTELFLEINHAYEILSDQNRRSKYDDELAESEAQEAEESAFRLEIRQSRKNLLQLDEPQVHYLLLDIFPAPDLLETRPPDNMAIVIDRSTSMRGPRLDQVRSATLTILRDLHPSDSASIVAFSDRAEVLVSPDQAQEEATARARMSLLQAGGGTEIGQGLELGLAELERNFSRDGVSHLILITDGRTYGDEELCLEMANEAATRGITINAIGIGSDWSDRFLDEVTSRTGGTVLFMDTPKAVTGLLNRIFEAMSRSVVNRVRLEGELNAKVDLRSAFKLLPDPMPLGDTLPMQLGALPRDGQIRVLLEVVIHPIGQIQVLDLAHLRITGIVLQAEEGTGDFPLSLRNSVSRRPDPDPPPEAIVSALSSVALYRMQEKARHEAELGQASQAARRLENLATHLLAGGERELARAALNEAERLTHTRRLSLEGEKMLKYGTRALLLPAPAKSSS